MKFRYFLAFVLMAAAALAPMQAQTTIQGRVLDGKSNEPLPFATVAILSADSTVINGTVADENGQFSLSVKEGRLLYFSFMGYTPEYRAFDPAQRSIEVSLKLSATMLEAVEVTAKAPVIEQQMDKLVMNVAQSAFAQGSNAEDLLRKAPGVSIDKDGNVKLNGQSVAVWIDGRPSQLDGQSLTAMLRSTDGTSIDKIEVIANPSAKYDAEGQGGIINIKTKRNFKQGFNGTLAANAGGMGYHRELEMTDPVNAFYFDQDVSLSLNYRTAKTNSFLQLSESTNQLGVDVASSTDLGSVGQDFCQHAASRYDADFSTYSLKLGSDWFVDKKNTLGFIVTMPFNRMTQSADTNGNRSYQMVAGAVTNQTMSYAMTEYHFAQYMGNINYTHTFDEAKMSELTANLDYMHYVNSSANPLRNYILAPSQELAWNPAAIIDSNFTDLNSERTVDVYSAKADWQGLVLGMFLMEAGGKYALTRTDNEMDRYLPYEDSGTLAFFDYTEHISALYATLAGQHPKGFSAKLGLRGEYTYAYNSENTVEQNYFDLFPTAYFGYNTPDMMKRFGISYTRRIERPNYNQLNPFQNFIDAHTSNMGNPALKPCYSNSLSLTAGFGQYVTLTGMYMHNKDVIGMTPQIDPLTGDQTLFFDNTGELRLMGGSFTLSELPLGKMLTLMVSANLFDFHSTAPTTTLLTGIPASAVDVDEHSFYGAGYGCLTLLLPKDWKVQLDGFLSTPITQGYMHIGWSYSTNLAVKKSTLDGRLLFSLSLNDIFRTMNSSFGICMDGKEISFYDQTHLMQTVKVGLQWNFGTAQKPLKHRNVGTLDEASRTANSNGIGK